jgi:hypothetical protein
MEGVQTHAQERGCVLRQSVVGSSNGWVNGVGGFGRRASEASGLSWGRSREQGRKEAGDARASRSGIGNFGDPEQEESGQGQGESELEKQWF